MQEKKKSIRDAFRAYQENPDLNGDKLLSVIENYRTTWSELRKKEHDAQWRMNAAFYAGQHYVRDGHSTTSYRVRLRENHTNNMMNRMLSIFVQNMPVPRVFASSISNDDIKNAETSEKYLKYLHRQKKMEQRYIKLVKYACIFGNGFIYSGWDPDSGGQLDLDSTETHGEAEKRLYRGDTKFSIDDPFRIAVRPGIDEMDDMYDIIRSEPASREGMEAKYGDDLGAEAAVAYNSYSDSLRKDEDIVMVHHYFHIPTPWFEEGLYACWVGKKLVKARPASESEKTLPVTQLPFDKPAMKFWGMASIEQVMDLQEQINRAASMIVEARNLMFRPRVFASHESQVPAQSLSDRPGEIIRYKAAGGAPQFVTPNFNFGEGVSHKQDLVSTMGSVMGITGASRGDIPAATRTALALQLVLEQDRSQYVPFIKSYHQAILDTNLKALQIAAEYIPAEDPRAVKVEGDFQSALFHGGMVPSPLDAYLEDTNPLGWTAAGRTESVLEIAKAGLIKDEQKILEMLKIPSADPAHEITDINRQTQEKENELLKQGQIVSIEQADNHGVHLEAMEKFMCSFAFKQMPQPVKDAFYDHVNQHKQAAAAEAQEAQAAAQGAAGPKTGGIEPDMMADQMQAPQPGQNLDELLTSARAG